MLSRGNSSSLKQHPSITCPRVKTHHFHMQADKNKATETPLCCCFCSCFSLISCMRSLSRQGILNCWKNNCSNKLHVGLLKSSTLFLARLYSLHSAKEHWENCKLPCVTLEQTLCHAALIPCHNWPSKLHKVIYKDRPRPWGKEITVNISYISV